jgi:dipeptidyl aminopeptidase/acylaminoacyl peptidase
MTSLNLAVLRRYVAALLCLAAGCVPAATEATPAPATAFFHNAQFSSAKLSPDGRRVAFLVASQGGHARLGVLDLQTMKANAAMAFDQADIAWFDWVNDRRLVFTQDAEYLAPGLFGVNHDGSGYRALVHSSGAFFRDPIGGREPLPADTRLMHINTRRQSDDVYVVRAQRYNKERGAGLYTLTRLNTVTGAAEELDNPLHASSWLMDLDDQLRVVVTRNDDKGAVRQRLANGSWQTVFEFNPREPARTEPNPLFWSPEGRLYMGAPVSGDKAGVYTYDLQTRKLAVTPMLASKDFDLHPSFIANDERLLGLRYTVDADVTLWLDPVLKAHQAVIDQLLPATSNRVSQARRPSLPYLLVEAYSDVQPSLYYVFNTETRKLTRLGAAHPEIQPAAMGQMDMVRYQARDGLEIPAWLTLPRGAEPKKNLPLVVWVHGGPWVRGAKWEWNPEVQFLASRGYAVLQPEFRGGTGFGAKHFKAGWKQLGLAMQTDLADGARWAIDQGIADPKRICIMGASYGGYGAMMGLVSDPDLFRCAVNWVGVTDIGLWFDVSWSDITDEAKRYGYRTLIGDPELDAAQFKATSPLQQAARITQPVLMAYGEWDRRVPQVHGEKMRDALKAHNPNVEWVVYEKEGHGWYKVETRLDFWGRVERFLARNLATP